jgi:hypothetical protein
VEVEVESGVKAVGEAVKVEDGIKVVGVKGKVDIKAVARKRIHLTLAEANSNMREVEHSSFDSIYSVALATPMPEPTADN